MAIVVRLDGKLALRKMRSKELAQKIDLTKASVAAEVGQGQGHPLRHARGDLCRARLSARRLARICAGGRLKRRLTGTASRL